MKIAILGTGVVGQSLGKGFVQLGHEVIIGTRDPRGESAKKALGAIKEVHDAAVSVATFSDAARKAELAVLATSWSGTEEALRLASANHLADKIVFDVTNPLDFSSGAPRLAVSGTDSGGERVQAWLPQSRVVKVFNTVGAARMYKPSFAEGKPTMFIGGNDSGAKAQVLALLEQFGWEGVDLGGIEVARYLEPYAMVWISYALKTNHWTHALKLIGR